MSRWSPKVIDGRKYLVLEPLEAPDEPAVGLYELRPCEHCDQPSWMARTSQRRRGCHPACHDGADYLTPEGERRTIFAIAVVLPVTSIEVQT